MAREIFISYSRRNLDKVKAIKKEIEQAANTECWMDLTDIESGERQFIRGIVDGIRSCRVYLFMLSKESQDSKYALRELNFAMMKAEEDKQKHVVIVNIDDCHLTDEFFLMYALTDTIAWNNQPQSNKLLRDIKAWLGRVIVEDIPGSTESVKKDIKKKAIEYQKLAGRQDDIIKELYSMNKSIGNIVKHCPVCEKEVPIQSQFCSQCGWQFPQLYGIDGGYSRLHDEADLAIARNCWQDFGSIVTLQKMEDILRGNFTVKGVSFKMIRVEGDTFRMGSFSEQDSEEKPVHEVTLSDYYIGETQVTQKLWQAVMGSNPSHFKGSNRPVEEVSWDDCQEFINQLNKLTGIRFRLPTEAEWEFAARGGKKSKGYRYSGGNNLSKVAWFEDNSNLETKEVKTKPANELGIYDMSGNVGEWCNDWYREYPSSPQTNPHGPFSGSDRVLRGGSWRGDASFCYAVGRNCKGPSYSGSDLGLRLAL